MDKYKNLNDFRSAIIIQYHNFPASAIRNIYFTYQSAEDKKADEALMNTVLEMHEKEEIRGEKPNILLEKAYMKTFW